MEGSHFQDITGAAKQMQGFGKPDDTINSYGRISTGEISVADTVSPSLLSQVGGNFVHFHNLILQ